MADEIPDDMTELYDADVPRVDLVGAAANGTRFLIAKGEDRAGLFDADYVRDLIAKSEPESPDPQETVTMTGSPAAIAAMIHGAALAKATPAAEPPAEELGNDVAKQADETPESTEVTKDMDEPEAGDGMDPTVILAEPAEDMPGSPSEPGSPAWEAIDAATACKWTAILARARAALDMMADRELLEAATADPADADNAMDLQDASCAIDYVIATLAPFAVNEQSEADQGAMEMIGKAMGEFNQAPIALLEALAPLAKSGRVLSTQNENAIRTAVASLQKVLASLPPAPDAPEAAPAAMQKEEVTAVDESAPAAVEKESAVDRSPAAPVEAPAANPISGLAPLTPPAETPAPATAPAPVVKADKPPQVAIYDANGNLVGTVDPAEITMLAPAQAPEAATKADDDAPADPATDATPAPEAPPADLTPAPPASVGTPADGTPAPDDDTVAKAADPETTHNLLKSIAEDLLKAAMDDYSAKQADVVKSLEERNKALEERLATVENQPAVMAIASNGAIPQPHQMRGQDYGATAVDLTKAQQLRTAFKDSDNAVEQQAYAGDLNALAIEKLRAIHAAGPQR